MSYGITTFELKSGYGLNIDKEIILLEIIKKLKEEKIHICIETSLFVSPDLVDLVKDFVDLFIIDIKILDQKNARNI